MRSSAAAQPLPDAQHRRKGTATNHKWAQYAGGAAAAAPRQRRQQRTVSAGETLHAAVRSTSRLRLVLAALLAVLLAGRWDAAAVGRSSSGAGGISGDVVAAGVPVAESAGEQAPDGPWAALQAHWQAAMQQAQAAATAVLPSRFKPASMAQQAGATDKASDSRASVFASMAGKLDRQLAVAAASPAGQQVKAALLVTRRQLHAAAASPAGQQAAAALLALRKRMEAAAASPAGQQAGAALQAARAALGDARQAASSQLASAWASPAGRRAAAVLAQLPPLATLPALARGRLAAAAGTPAGQRALQALDRLPPLASLLLLELSLVGAAAAAMAAAPTLVHSTVSGSPMERASNTAPRQGETQGGRGPAASASRPGASTEQQAASWFRSGAGRHVPRAAACRRFHACRLQPAGHPCSEPLPSGQPIVRASLPALFRHVDQGTVRRLGLPLCAHTAYPPPSTPIAFPSPLSHPPGIPQLELELQAPGLVQRLAGLVPGLSRQLSLLAALPRLLTGLLDDAAAFVAALVCYYQLPALMAGA